ncbi:MAG: hypothetical protein SGJ13_08375 [Actinomycetota bacterium]|nr:hypothetical protein [Actinomycetota bacterium]
MIVAGCGGDDDDEAGDETTDESSTVSIDPCSLITQAEADALAGMALQEPILTQADTSSCTFTEVEGLGDEAYLEDFTIFFRNGETWVALRLVLLEDPAAYNEPLTNLAKTMAGRM